MKISRRSIPFSLTRLAALMSLTGGTPTRGHGKNLYKVCLFRRSTGLGSSSQLIQRKDRRAPRCVNHFSRRILSENQTPHFTGRSRQRNCSAAENQRQLHLPM